MSNLVELRILEKCLIFNSSHPRHFEKKIQINSTSFAVEVHVVINKLYPNLMSKRNEFGPSLSNYPQQSQNKHQIIEVYVPNPCGVKGYHNMLQ